MNNHQSPLSKGHIPHTPRRMSITSDQRPSTSSGERIEPTSAFLREALREKKGLPPRARSTTPRRVRTAQRSLVYKDEWLQSSGDEGAKKDRTPVTRPVRTRRASDITASTMKTNFNAPPSVKPLGSRETDLRIDRLEKESWDLKHRITLYQEQTKRLNEDLEKKDNEIERLQNVEGRMTKMELEITSLKSQLQATQEENSRLQENNIEITQLNEEVVQQLEQRVAEIEQLEKDNLGRQKAIEEAAGIIQTLEQRLIAADKQITRSRNVVSPQPDSDYFSGDSKQIQATVKASPSVNHPPLLAPDSDYFSADTSPLITPKSVTQTPTAKKNSPSQLFLAKETSVAFNREMGLRSTTSKDSLFSRYLETPDLPLKSLAMSGVNRLRSLRKKTEIGKITPRNTESPKSNKKIQHQGWSGTRPLRNLYMNGELGQQVQGQPKEIPRTPPTPYSQSPEDGNQKARSNPSISVAMVEETDQHNTPVGPSHHVRSNSTVVRPMGVLLRHHTSPARSSPPRTSPNMARAHLVNTTPTQFISPQSTGNSQRSSNQSQVQGTPPHMRHLRAIPQDTSSTPPLMTIPSTYAAPPAQTAPTFSATKQTTETHRVPAPNTAIWPKRYPAWPPSAGLTNRNLLYHGDDGEHSPTRTDDGSPTDETGRHW